MSALSAVVVDGGYDLLLGSCCAGCDRPGRPWCRQCAAGLAAAVRAARPTPSRPHPAPVGLPPTWAAGGYGGMLRTGVLAYKERGRRALARPLGLALAGPLRTAALGWPEVCCVPVPASRSGRAARGYDHVDLLVRAAAAHGAPAAVPLLRWVRRTGDQAGLGAAGRQTNVAGALAASPRARGRCVVLADDVLTTGSTLAEASRALTAAGAQVVAAATVAATQRRLPP